MSENFKRKHFVKVTDEFRDALIELKIVVVVPDSVPYMPLKNQDISELIRLFSQFRDYANVGASLLGAAVIALEELEQQRQSLARGIKPGNWEAVMGEVRKIDKRLAEHLARADVQKFDSKKLKLFMQNDQDMMFLRFGKESLLKALQKLYGPNFKLTFDKKR